MQVIEIFLPLKRNDGSPQPPELFDRIRSKLVEEYGGMTAYARAPAEGIWQTGRGSIDEDTIVIFEVMAELADRAWWSSFRGQLERLFEQSSILIRASEVTRL